MKEFNLEVEWNAAEGKYDSALHIKGHTMNEIIETMTDTIVHAFDNICDNEVESAVASTTIALLISEKLDNLYGNTFTFEQKRDILACAEKIHKTMGG